MSKSCFAIVATSCLFASFAAAGGVAGSFTAGTLIGDGFPGPLNTAPSSMGASKGSGNGSTGGGFAAAQVGLTDTPVNTKLGITGHAEHDSIFGYTAVYTSDAIIFNLTQAADFSVLNSSTLVPGNPNRAAINFNPIVFEALTGSITGDILSGGTLSAGTYSIRFTVAAMAVGSANFLAIPNGYTAFDDTGILSADVDWSMTLTSVPTPGTLAMLGLAGLAVRRRR